MTFIYVVQGNIYEVWMAAVCRLNPITGRDVAGVIQLISAGNQCPDWATDWLAGWLEWLTSWLDDWLTDCMSERVSDGWLIPHRPSRGQPLGGTELGPQRLAIWTYCVFSWPILKWRICVCDFHIVFHLCWASGGGATNSPSHVLYMGVSYSC